MIGTLAGSYRIVGTISVGGMGTVYRAEHTLLGRAAAVKVLNPDMSTNRDIVNRFFNEARATTSIKHPGIIEVFDFGYLESGHAYLVMEFLDGAPLSTRQRTRGPISENEAAAILRGICSALNAAHAKGIVHRDLKPDNIFMVPDADSPLGERPKLLDFGIAKLTDIGLAGTATKTGAVMGTPTYMSPEQCKGTGEVDHRADLYSLGCIFYELVTGRPPFTDRGAGELIGAHLFMQPDPVSRHAHGLSPDVEALIMALLAKSPNERPQSALELAQRLAPIAQRGGLGSAVGWETVRPSMPYAAASPSDAMRYPTPAGMSAGMPVPTPMGGPMPTPMGGPMPTPMGGPMPTPMGGRMPTPMPPSAATDPTTLSGAASEVSRPRGAGKRIAVIAGLAIAAGAIAMVVVLNRGDSGGDASPPAPAKGAATPATPAAVTPTAPATPAAVTPTAPATPAAVTPPAPPPTTPPAAATPPAATPPPVAAPPSTTPAAPAKPVADAPKPPANPTVAKPSKPAAPTPPKKPAKPGKPDPKADNPLLNTDL